MGTRQLGLGMAEACANTCFRASSRQLEYIFAANLIHACALDLSDLTKRNRTSQTAPPSANIVIKNIVRASRSRSRQWEMMLSMPPGCLRCRWSTCVQAFRFSRTGSGKQFPELSGGPSSLQVSRPSVPKLQFANAEDARGRARIHGSNHS
ncbi:hypothetical protein L227DRAFT_172854 [Lentinus tigrinus ALCF2SS1-6]|uniref:Uncharacterized protein n=1 Tax=Lentinus tigrinus ALCF2SS1-6 TaxID=1328759 RepID=A0A5C2S7J7_9APHY|nr:hypothetical protein L227DRAFT_172854 [Lentinus tigrinus ALCF2SS1-6]